TSPTPNASRRVIAGKTAQNVSQYRHALQICIWRATSASGPLPAASEAASRASSSSCCICRPFLCGSGRLGACDPAEGGADAHADAGGVSLSQHVAGHHFARDEEVVAGLAVEVDLRLVVGLEAQVGEGDPGPQGV